MSKELTEKWKEGTLPQGWYYVKTPCGEIKKLYCGDGESLELDDPETAGYYFFHRNLNKGQVEVLEPVPSYEQFIGLMDDSKELDKAYDKINLLEKQLKEANEVIKKYSNFKNWEGDDKDQHCMIYFVGEDIGCGWSIAYDYLKKWGVE